MSLFVVIVKLTFVSLVQGIRMTSAVAQPVTMLLKSIRIGCGLDKLLKKEMRRYDQAPSFTFAVDLMNWSNPLTTVMPFFSSDFDDLEARIVNLSKSCKFPGEAFRLIVPNSCETQMKSIGNFIRPLIDKKASLEMFVDHLKSQIYLQGNEKVEQMGSWQNWKEDSRHVITSRSCKYTAPQSAANTSRNYERRQSSV